jgi:hypothetical protein
MRSWVNRDSVEQTEKGRVVVALRSLGTVILERSRPELLYGPEEEIVRAVRELAVAVIGLAKGEGTERLNPGEIDSRLMSLWERPCPGSRGGGWRCRDRLSVFPVLL